MAHITLSIPDELYEEMKKHKEIKWSEAAREGLKYKLSEMKGVISGKDLLKRLDTETRRAIKEIPEKEWIKGYKKMKESERKRLRYLTLASSSKGK